MEAKHLNSRVNDAAIVANYLAAKASATLGELSERLDATAMIADGKVERTTDRREHRGHAIAEKASRSVMEIASKVVHAAQETAHKLVHDVKEATHIAGHRHEERVDDAARKSTAQ